MLVVEMSYSLTCITFKSRVQLDCILTFTPMLAYAYTKAHAFCVSSSLHNLVNKLSESYDSFFSLTDGNVDICQI